MLDLRNNGGGSMQEAIDLVNLFIGKGKTVVELKGKIKSANETYKTMAVFPMSRITDSSLGIAPRILVTRRKSFCRRSIQLVVYIIDCIAG